MLKIREYLYLKFGKFIESISFFELFFVLILSGYFIVGIQVLIFRRYGYLYMLFVLGFCSLFLLVHQDFKRVEISGEATGYIRKKNKERALKIAKMGSKTKTK